MRGSAVWIVAKWALGWLVFMVGFVLFINRMSASASEAPLQFTGISVDGEYVYRAGHYERRLVRLDGALAIAQLDFFPPDSALPCVWIRSRLETLRAPATYADVRIEYCGGVGWQHLTLEPRAPGWARWVVEIGRPGEDSPDDQREFFVRRPDG